MKTHISKAAITFAALLATASGTVLAQQATGSAAPSNTTQTEAPRTSNASPAASTAFITEQKSSQILATSIIGMSVRNGPGEDAKEIGKVNDLILDKDHKLVGIVVGVGGFLGIGQKDVGIPWESVSNINPETKVAQVGMSKEQLENAPTFTSETERKSQEKQEQQKQKMQQQQPLQPAAGTGAPAPAPQPAPAQKK